MICVSHFLFAVFGDVTELARKVVLSQMLCADDLNQMSEIIG